MVCAGGTPHTFVNAILNVGDVVTAEIKSASVILGNAAAATHLNRLPSEVLARAQHLFLDTLAIIAGAGTHPVMRRLADEIAPAFGSVTFIGGRRGATLRDALLLNAAATTVLQRQDGYAHAKGHPASQLVPLLLGIAEHKNCSAEAMLSAFIAGYEVAARVGKALGGVPTWLHDSGNWTLMGLAAGAAHLLTAGQASPIAAAIDGVSSLALAFDRFTTVGGATMHHLYPAMAVTDALTAAQAAAAGLTSLPGTLERYYGPRFGAAFRAEELIQGIDAGGWSSFEILNGYFKLHPSCAHMHGVGDAVDQLIAEEGLTADNFSAISVDLFGEAMEINTDTPHNDLAARFSAKATVAAALRYGRLDDMGLNDLTVLEPLMARITVRHDPSLDVYTPAGRPGRVTATFADGRRAVREVIYPCGTAEVPASPAQRQDKAHHLLARHYGPARAKLLIDLCGALGQGIEVDDLSEALRDVPE